jgi:serine protease Do
MSLFLVSAILLGAEPSMLQSTSNEQVALVEKLSNSVVFIATDDGFGSGFFVAENGLILTNAHVIDKAANPRVILHDGRKFLSRVVEVGSEDTDVALIQIDLPKAPVLPLEQAIPKVGEWVGAIGHGSGALFSFNSGMVSNVYAEGADKPVFQTQIPLNPGNSGGPIFNAKGAVVGIVTSAIRSAAAIYSAYPNRLSNRCPSQFAAVETK